MAKIAFIVTEAARISEFDQVVDENTTILKAGKAYLLFRSYAALAIIKIAIKEKNFKECTRLEEDKPRSVLYPMMASDRATKLP